MHYLQSDLRQLFESLFYNEEHLPVYNGILVPWVESHTDQTDWFRSFASKCIERVYPAEVEELWRLYAFSRVNEALLLCFQPGQSTESGLPCPSISLEEYTDFSVSLGLSNEDSCLFSPFHHEIVIVDQAEDDNQNITLEETLWPCLMLGNMLFSRAGVRVSGGKNFIRKNIAEMSTLYWAYRRNNRPHQDLSHDWGGNSQWRTRFRRDYRFGRELHYNVDGKSDISVSEPTHVDRNGLTIEERIELLVNRCFIRCDKPNGDLWPYYDRYSAVMCD